MCNKENKASIWRRKKKKNGDELKETYQIKNGEEEEWQWSGLRILVDVSTWMVKKKQDDGNKIEEDGSLFQEEDDCRLQQWSEEEANVKWRPAVKNSGRRDFKGPN